jgi:hypothetical protein
MSCGKFGQAETITERSFSAQTAAPVAALREIVRFSAGI